MYREEKAKEGVEKKKRMHRKEKKKTGGKRKGRERKDKGGRS